MRDFLLRFGSSLAEDGVGQGWYRVDRGWRTQIRHRRGQLPHDFVSRLHARNRYLVHGGVYSGSLESLTHLCIDKR